MELISYGAITEDFKDITKLKRYLKNINNKQSNEIRLDCYSFINDREIIYRLFEKLKLPVPLAFEIFKPSDNYPPHVDEGGISYFIPLESGTFFIGNINYPIVPFVLYAFNDGIPHNSNFCSIMLK